MTTIRTIALDPGFGGFKAAEVQGDAVRVVTMPSAQGHRLPGGGPVRAGRRHREAGCRACDEAAPAG